MVRTSYLRVYQEPSEFPVHERRRWSEIDDAGEYEAQMARRWLMTRAMPDRTWTESIEGAFVRKLDDRLLVCPWRTRLRMLAGLISFRETLTVEVADAFVPEDEAIRAAQELAAITDGDPYVRSHILHANWHVPLRWFTAFDGDERILVEDRAGLRVRYETSLSEARARISRALHILERADVDDVLQDAVRELAAWLEQFTGEGLLELDYGSVASLLEDDDLVEDHSAADVWSCLDALAAGDAVASTRLFTRLNDRWSAIRVNEILN